MVMVEVRVSDSSGFPFQGKYRMEPEEMPGKLREIGRAAEEFFKSDEPERLKAEYLARHPRS